LDHLENYKPQDRRSINKIHWIKSTNSYNPLNKYRWWIWLTYWLDYTNWWTCVDDQVGRLSHFWWMHGFLIFDECMDLRISGSLVNNIIQFDICQQGGEVDFHLMIKMSWLDISISYQKDV